MSQGSDRRSGTKPEVVRGEALRVSGQAGDARRAPGDCASGPSRRKPLALHCRVGAGEAAEGAEGSLGYVHDGHPRGDTRRTAGRDEATGGKEAELESAEAAGCRLSPSHPCWLPPNSRTFPHLAGRRGPEASSVRTYFTVPAPLPQRT